MKSLTTRSIARCFALSLVSLLAAACAPEAGDGSEDAAEASQDITLNPYPLFHDAPNKAFIWQGFQHDWDYNHRINRLGDWVDNTGCSGTTCSATVAHSAASGSGADHAFGATSFDFVGGQNLGFVEGESTFEVDTTEALRITQTNHVNLDFGLIPNMQQRGRYFAYLNGFDVVAVPLDNGNTRAKKIQVFSLGVSGETKTATGVSFDVTLGFMFDCDSAECALDSDEVRYRVVAHYGLIGGEATDFAFAVQSPSTTYSWDTDNEIIGDQVVNATRTGVAGMSRGTLAIRGFSFDVHEHQDGTQNNGLHMLGMDDQLVPVSYNSATGTMSYKSDMAFKQWAFGMEDTHAPDSWFSYREDGLATIRTDVALLQVAQGCVKWPTGRLIQSHGIDWPGGDVSADTSAAIDQETRSLDFSGLGCP